MKHLAIRNETVSERFWGQELKISIVFLDQVNYWRSLQDPVDLRGISEEEIKGSEVQFSLRRVYTFTKESSTNLMKNFKERVEM